LTVEWLTNSSKQLTHHKKLTVCSRSIPPAFSLTVQ
jgi:hypothetical protein